MKSHEIPLATQHEINGSTLMPAIQLLRATLPRSQTILKRPGVMVKSWGFNHGKCGFNHGKRGFNHGKCGFNHEIQSLP
jgi:hypothetical protein